MPNPVSAQVMIVEDDALLALDLASTLRRAGLQVVGPFLSVDAAMRAVLSTSLILRSLISICRARCPSPLPMPSRPQMCPSCG